MNYFAGAACAFLIIPALAHADQLLDRYWDHSSNAVIGSGDQTLNVLKNNKSTTAPKPLSLTQNNNNLAGDVSGISANTRPKGCIDMLCERRSMLSLLAQGGPGQVLSQKSGAPGDVAWVNSCLNIEAFGGVADGVGDNAPALDAALAALPPGGGCIYSPRGKRVFKRPVAYTYAADKQSITVAGDGINSSEWFWPATDGLILTLKDTTTTFHARDLAFTTGATELRNGIKLTVPGTNANGALGEYSDFTNVVFRGEDGYAQTYGWKTALVIDNVSNVNVDNASFIGTAASRGYGIRVSGKMSGAEAVIYNFSKSSWVHLDTAIEYGSNVQGMTISQANFTAVSRGVLVPPTASGVLSQLTIVASQFALNPNTGWAAIDIQAPVNPLIVANNLFLSNGPGTQINLQVHSFSSVAGNIFYSPIPNNNTAITMGAGQSPTKVADNIIYGFALGIALPDATSNASITNNALTGNAIPISFASTSANANLITGNSGFQPQVPVNQSVTTSPWTYSSPGLPANVCITAGAVTNVKIDGAIIANGSPGCVPLEPNQTIAVTFATAPAIVIGIR